MSKRIEKTDYLFEPKGWDKVISAVRTPLGYSVFAVLSGLLILPMGLFSSNAAMQATLVAVSLGLIILSIVYVFVMSFFRPEALKGERTSNWVMNANSTTELSERHKNVITNNDSNPAKIDSLVIDVLVRGNAEAEGSDKLLHSATKAKFIGLTFKTLGTVLTTDHGVGKLSNVKTVEMSVYALPILHDWHPTLRGTQTTLTKEWVTGLIGTITALCDKQNCPALQKLDLRIISRTPTLTASAITANNGVGNIQTRIRFTPLLEEEEPANTPTIELCVPMAADDCLDPLFLSYRRLIDNLRTGRSPIIFPILRTHPYHYQRPNIKEFVERLTFVCNHPRYELRDAFFSVDFFVSAESANVLGNQVNTFTHERAIKPDDVFEYFDALRVNGDSDQFRVSFDLSKLQANIVIGKMKGDRNCKSQVDGSHIIGAFALITRRGQNGQEVLLVDKEKRPWPYDVPGGKVVTSDSSLEDAVTREVFEELGLIFDTERLSGPIEFKYDKRSQKEGVPVIAAYFHYPLQPKEEQYLEHVLQEDRTARHMYPLVFYPIDSLIEKKSLHRDQGLPGDDFEAECHAPLEVFRQVLD